MPRPTPAACRATPLAALILLAACQGRPDVSAPPGDPAPDPEPSPTMLDGGHEPSVDAGQADPGDAGPTDGGAAIAFDAGGTDAGDGTPDDGGTPTTPVFINAWGGYGIAPGQFIEPSSVELTHDGIVIVAGHEDRIQRFTPEGELLDIFGTAGAGDGQFNHPHGLAVDHLRDDTLFVGDQENHRLQVFTPDGQFIRQWGDALFQHIHDVGIDRTTGNVFVGDYEVDILRKFSPEGDLLASYGGFGAGPGFFEGVWGISTDADSNVYVADTFNHRIQKLSVNGAFLQEWTDFEGVGFQKPTGVFIDTQDVVYVCDSLAETVYLFDTQGSPLERWDLAAIYGQPSEPEDIVISPDGRRIYIGEVAGHRVLQLRRPEGWPAYE